MYASGGFSTYRRHFLKSNTVRFTDCLEKMFYVFFSQIGVLTVTMAYGFVRMFYMKQPDFAAGAYVYMLDALSVVMTIVALAPAAMKFAMIGRIVNQLQSFSGGATDMLKLCNNFERILSKTLLFIQEVEVIQRGYTLYVVKHILSELFC